MQLCEINVDIRWGEVHMIRWKRFRIPTAFDSQIQQSGVFTKFLLTCLNIIVTKFKRLFWVFELSFHSIKLLIPLSSKLFGFPEHSLTEKPKSTTLKRWEKIYTWIESLRQYFEVPPPISSKQIIKELYINKIFCFFPFQFFNKIYKTTKYWQINCQI